MSKNVAAKFDIVNTLPPRLATLNVSSNLFGKYANVPSGEMSNLLSGKKRVSNTRAEAFYELVADLEKVAAAFSPVPVDFTKVDRVRQIIRDLKDGSLVVCVIANGRYHASGTSPLMRFA
jgi:hypothetical protein